MPFFRVLVVPVVQHRYKRVGYKSEMKERKREREKQVAYLHAIKEASPVTLVCIVKHECVYT